MLFTKFPSVYRHGVTSRIMRYYYIWLYKIANVCAEWKCKCQWMTPASRVIKNWKKCLFTNIVCVCVRVSLIYTLTTIFHILFVFPLCTSIWSSVEQIRGKQCKIRKIAFCQYIQYLISVITSQLRQLITDCYQNDQNDVFLRHFLFSSLHKTSIEYTKCRDKLDKCL